MKNIILLSLLLILYSCQDQPVIKHSELYGTWIEHSESDGFSPDKIKTITFQLDGTFYSEIKSINDSIIHSIEGTFEIDTNNMVIKFTNEGWVLKDMEVIELTETALKTKVTEEFEGSSILQYSRE
ncbi:lipocalin family protein [bacterium SCSIO 12643]|nr:lipocalin family protein [bacterium SCSIO 12643]